MGVHEIGGGSVSVLLASNRHNVRSFVERPRTKKRDRQISHDGGYPWQSYYFGSSIVSQELEEWSRGGSNARPLLLSMMAKVRDQIGAGAKRGGFERIKLNPISVEEDAHSDSIFVFRALDLPE